MRGKSRPESGVERSYEITLDRDWLQALRLSSARDDDEEFIEDVLPKSGHAFTPEYKKGQARIPSGELKGVSVRGLPEDVIETELVLTLEEAGMPKYHKEYSIKSS